MEAQIGQSNNPTLHKLSGPFQNKQVNLNHTLNTDFLLATN